MEASTLKSPFARRLSGNQDSMFNPVMCVLPVPIPESLVSVDLPLFLLPVPYLAPTTWVPVTRPVCLGNPRSLVPQYGRVGLPVFREVTHCFPVRVNGLPCPGVGSGRILPSQSNTDCVSRSGNCSSELWCAGISNPCLAHLGLALLGDANQCCVPGSGPTTSSSTAPG